jgi:hypothetical protein
MIRSRRARAVRALRLSFWIHAAGYVVAAAVFIAISVGLGDFVMKWPLIWVTVVVLGHGAVLAVFELVTRYGDQAGQGS